MNTVMHPENRHHRTGRLAMLAAVPVLALGLTGCAQDTAGPEEGATVEDVQELDENDAAIEDEITENYDGFYNQDLYDQYDEYEGETVTVSATVNEILSPDVFTIAGTDDTTVDALPVLHTDEVDGLIEGTDVRVTGTAMVELDIAEIEERTGIVLDPDTFGDWEGQPYLDATTVDASVDYEEE
ncbi:hypothetical protein [Planctomonas psychrotolerans]|uniref:hypothetical protein n=1 Tax=Planctomonas psychrotolerans TaxID=2528712 RepID=UPI001238F701|nr:hypothetical protein [Planctomonas psychrotolerans]